MARPQPIPARPRRLGHFEVIEEIGQGGMGVVFLARQPTLDRRVVLKRIRRELSKDPVAVERFHLEARAAAAVHHQNVVTVYDCFSFRGDAFIAQEWVAGIDVAELIARVGAVDPLMAARVGLELARGLEAIHAAGIVHRDLKPSNLLLSPDGKAKIADFGIALDAFQNGLTQPGTTLGSFPYMSPEQLRGERVDARSDLYNLGLVLFEMLTGTPAFSVDVGEGAADNLLEKIVSDSSQLDTRMNGAPRWLRRAVRRCLELQPKDRYASALELREELEDRIGDPSPSLTHARIGAFLDRAGLIAASEATQRIPAAPARSRRWKPKAWHVLPLLGALLVGLPWVALDSGWLPAGLGRGETPELIREPATESPLRAVAVRSVALDPEAGLEKAESETLIPAALSVQPAQLHVVVEPWASVAIEGHEPYWTPRQRPTELDAGRYTVTLSHPKLGSVSYEVEMKAGEHLWLRHRFEEVAP